MLLHSISRWQDASGQPWVISGGSGGRVKRRGMSRRRKELGLEQKHNGRST